VRALIPRCNSTCGIRLRQFSDNAARRVVRFRVDSTHELTDSRENNVVAIIRTEWSGTSGGPGLTQLAVTGAAGGIWNPDATQAAVNAMRVFWFGIAGYLPDELKLTVQPTIDVYNESNGELTNSYTATTPPAVVSGTSAAIYAAGAGFKITWGTGQIRNGRRVRGTTFVVPAASNVYSASGTIVPAVMTAVNNQANNLLSQLSAAGTSLAVWSRPVDAPEARLGVVTSVTGAACSSKTSILRGRRD
jgi:hypothetical protein